MMNKKTVVVAGTVGTVGVGVIVYKLIKMNKLKKQQESQATTDNEETEEIQENVTTNETEVEDAAVEEVPDINNETQEEKDVYSKINYENDLDDFYQHLLTLGVSEEDALAIKNIAIPGYNDIINGINEFLNK